MLLNSFFEGPFYIFRILRHLSVWAKEHEHNDKLFLFRIKNVSVEVICKILNVLCLRGIVLFLENRGVFELFTSRLKIWRVFEFVYFSARDFTSHPSIEFFHARISENYALGNILIFKKYL